MQRRHLTLCNDACFVSLVCTARNVIHNVLAVKHGVEQLRPV